MEKIAHYRITGELGAGGMGVVYRARDTKLERDVAIKVLPEELSRDPERLARFEREARLLAQLNHTNIAVLHGFEKDDGRPFLVMELVEGETLAERIARGPITVGEALTLFIQIAEGLEAAHEKGIVHRDLKPPNIKITPDDHIKILDFGLAKAFLSDDDVSAETSQSPTLTKNTALGAIMGTASYMSPEQARGKTVDKRTDIWAFGCCLYEVLTGKKAFEGETVTDVIAAVVNKEPEWNALSASVPRHVRHLIERCLRKSARERVRDIGDARLELLEKETDTGAGVHGAWSTQQKIATVVAPLLALVVGLWVGGVFDTAVVSKPMHVSVEIAPAELIGDAGATSGFFRLGREQWLTRTALALSPNGEHLVFVGWQDDQQLLFHRPLGAPLAQPILGTENALNPFFSPDGRWIGFWSEGELKKVAFAGGPVIPLCTAAPIFGASWGDDDTIVFAGRISGLMAVAADGGAPRILVEKNDGEQMVLPWVLPGASAVLFTVRRELSSWGEATIVVQSLESGERKTLVEGGANPVFTESGHLLYVKLGVLWAAPFDPVRLEVSAPAVPVLEGIVQNVQDNSITNRTGAAHISVSASGNLAYLEGGLVEDTGRSLVWVDRNGESERLPFEAGRFWSSRLSPDGGRIAIAEPEGVSILDLRRVIQQRLPESDLDAHVGAWSPDGARIVFADPGSRAVSLFWQLADGSESPQPLTTSQHVQFAGPWNPSSSEILFFERERGRATWDTFALSMPPSEGNPRPVLTEASSNEFHASFSPDGRWIAYASDESGRFEVYLRSYPSLEGKQQISRSGGVMPIWSRTGDELFYLVPRPNQQGQEVMMAVELSSSDGLRAGTPRELFRGQFGMSVAVASYDVAPDGRFLMISPGKTSAPAHTAVRLVLNWFEELETLAPHEN